LTSAALRDFYPRAGATLLSPLGAKQKTKIDKSKTCNAQTGKTARGRARDLVTNGSGRLGRLGISNGLLCGYRGSLRFTGNVGRGAMAPPLIEINESVSFDSSFTAGADAAGELD
jgi:hypothetical protein